MKIYKVDVRDFKKGTKFTRVEASDSAYDLREKYRRQYPNLDVRVYSNSQKSLYIIGGAIFVSMIVLCTILLISLS